MSKVADEIREYFQEYKKILEGDERETSICEGNPFHHSFWMYNYLFPEVLLVKKDFSYYERECRSKYQGYMVFPCWLIPEEDVLRVMAECGIL